MKKMLIIFISLIVGYALYWGISNNNYKMDKKLLLSAKTF